MIWGNRLNNKKPCGYAHIYVSATLRSNNFYNNGLVTFGRSMASMF